MTLKEAIKRASGAKVNFPLLCEVNTVNNDGTIDCTPLDEPEFFGVRINAEISPAKGVIITPKEGSKVFIIPINQETGIVVLSSEVTGWLLKIGTATIEQNDEGLLIQKDSDTLKEVIQLIIEAVQKIVVIQGQNPDYAKLTQALTKAQNILR